MDVDFYEWDGASVVYRLSSIYRLGIENATTKNKTN